MEKKRRKKTKKPVRKKGKRKSNAPVKKSTQTKYYNIYIAYANDFITQEQLAKNYKCSRSTIKNALRYISEQKAFIPPEITLNAAIDSVKNRIQQLQEDLKTARARDIEKKNIFHIVALQKEIRENHNKLMELEKLIVIQHEYKFPSDGEGFMPIRIVEVRLHGNERSHSSGKNTKKARNLQDSQGKGDS